MNKFGRKRIFKHLYYPLGKKIKSTYKIQVYAFRNIIFTFAVLINLNDISLCQQIAITEEKVPLSAR
jgi:hypothetical protein